MGFITSVIWEETLDWLYSQLMGLISDFFQQMNNMGAQIFELSWVKAIILFFTQFGWAMFLIGLVVAVFDTAVGAQTGRADIKGTALNAMKGFFAVSLFSVLPVRLYQFSITLQGSLSHGLARLLSVNVFTPAGLAQAAIDQIKSSGTGSPGLFNTLLIIALVYCVVKVFFQNLKRGGILLIQIAVGSLYLFSVPRGYTDGWIQWCKRVIGPLPDSFPADYYSDGRPHYIPQQLSAGVRPDAVCKRGGADCGGFWNGHQCESQFVWSDVCRLQCSQCYETNRRCCEIVGGEHTRYQKFGIEIEMTGLTREKAAPGCRLVFWNGGAACGRRL